MSRFLDRSRFRVSTSVAAALLLVAAVSAVTSGLAQGKKDFSVSAHKYNYKVEGTDRAEIRVQQGDMVRITFSSDDIPHSFTLIEDGDQHYRIMRRAEPGHPVTFEFLADKAGDYVFQCTLTADSRCKELQGHLIVEPKK